jgi:hypothetical protein
MKPTNKNCSPKPEDLRMNSGDFDDIMRRVLSVAPKRPIVPKKKKPAKSKATASR